MRFCRNEAGECTPGVVVAVMTVNFVFVAIVAVGSVAGVRWAVATAAAIGAFAGVVWLWDRRAMSRLPEPEPAWLEEMNRPDTAAELAAPLADYVADVLAVAHLDDDDRRRLEDIERRLRVQAGGRRLENLVASERRRKQLELAPYTGEDIAAVVAVLNAEGLLSGRCGQLEVADWSPPAPADAEALSWFVDRFERIVDVDEAERGRTAAQDWRWRRPRAASRR